MSLSRKQFDFLLHSNKDVNVANGSIRSGKTYIQMVRFLEFLENEAIENEACILSAKSTMTSVRNLVDPLLKIASSIGTIDDFSYNRATNVLTYNPKGIQTFVVGANDEGSEARIRGMTAQAWVADEVTLYPRSFYLQAYGRCSAGKRYKWFTCNPDSPNHWFKREVIDEVEKGNLNGQVWWFTLLDNPSLDEEYKKNISRQYTGTWYDRMILGKWVSSGNAVFERWHVEDDFEPPEDAFFYFGMDWGFSEDPTVLVRCYIHDDVLYIDHERYASGVDINNIPDMIGDVPEVKRFPIFADNSRPETISYMRNHGFGKMAPAKKWKGCVEDGIARIRAFNDIVIHKRCEHTIGEFQSYSYVTDKKTGLVSDKLEDANNHCIDALRYALDSVIQSRSRFVSNVFMV